MNDKNLSVKALLSRYKLRSRQSIYDWIRKGLRQEFKKDEAGKAYATPDQVALLDQLEKYLQKPNAVLSDFIPLSTVQIDSPIDSLEESNTNGKESGIKTQPIDNQLLLELTARIGWAISSQLAQQLTETNRSRGAGGRGQGRANGYQYSPPQLSSGLYSGAVQSPSEYPPAPPLPAPLPHLNPLYRHEALEKAKELRWLLTTKEVQKLIGVKPQTKKGEKSFKRGNWLFIKIGKIGAQTAWQVDKILCDRNPTSIDDDN